MAPSYVNKCMKYRDPTNRYITQETQDMAKIHNDILMIWGHGRYENFIHLANNLHPTIKFSFNTNEQEIPFLDTYI